LAYSRVKTRGTEFALTNLNDVLSEVRSNLQMAIAESGANIVSDRLPQLYADKTQMVQVFQNLITNAIKFNKSLNPEIAISAKRNEHDWVVNVRDNGIGIDPRYFERIFMIFQRLHTRIQYKGTGIGLAICKKIVEHHGGRIWVESTAGQGADFYFSIPFKEHAE
jgi:chemotaxis family two-component system sensor kinase Cph1